MCISLQGQLAVGAMGYPILCEVVREEREDLDMLHGALECLVLSLACGQPPPVKPARPQASVKLMGPVGIST